MDEPPNPGPGKSPGFLAELRVWSEDHKGEMIALALVTVCAYGFELFNLNLTIDEEVHAFTSSPDLWISQGRWGMYLLNRFLLSYPVIPFVPLFVALIFQMAAVLMLLHAWKLPSGWPRVIVGGMALTYPGLVYLYSFSTLNYGIGIGLFCIALSVLAASRLSGWRRLFASVPAALSISIYQGFVPALAVAFLVDLVVRAFRGGGAGIDRRRVVWLGGTMVLGAVLYYLVQQLFLLGSVTGTGYVDQYFDLGFLRDNFSLAVSRSWEILGQVYSGDAAIYARPITALGPTLAVAVAGFVATTLSYPLRPWHKVMILVLGGVLLIVPFAPGLVTRGYLAMRFLISLPVLMLGFLTLGFLSPSRLVRGILGVLGAVCLFQFVVSTNTLFSASRLALEADRTLAARLIVAIDDAKALAHTPETPYLEVVGYPEVHGTPLIPKAETIGASFFEWDQGNIHRILRFLWTLRYDELDALPVERRAGLIDVASQMPIWPAPGSVRVAGDTVIVKFGPYSPLQKQGICQTTWVIGFCQ